MSFLFAASCVLQHTHTLPLSFHVSLSLSQINGLRDAIQVSPLWEDEPLRRKVLLNQCPPCLVKLLGVDKIMKRVPVNYLRRARGEEEKGGGESSGEREVRA